MPGLDQDPQSTRPPADLGCSAVSHHAPINSQHTADRSLPAGSSDVGHLRDTATQEAQQAIAHKPSPPSLTRSEVDTLGDYPQAVTTMPDTQ
eukprot:1158075-Pelagomonas_calceolata.AAC.5